MTFDIHFGPEMIAAGIEAMREARSDGMTEGEAVMEIYLAMRGYEIKAICGHAEPVH